METLTRHAFSSPYRTKRRQRAFKYAKLYLLALFLFMHLVALLDGGGIPYFPLELSSLLVTHHTRKSLFLAFSAPVSFLLWVIEPDNWSLRGIGISLFLMVLFDVGNEWPLHMLAVFIFAFCLASYTENVERKGLLKASLVVYAARLIIKLAYLWCYEQRHYDVSLLVMSKELSALGCSGYAQCGQPWLTVWVLRGCALLQWLLFILLSVTITE